MERFWLFHSIHTEKIFADLTIFFEGIDEENGKKKWKCVTALNLNYNASEGGNSHYDRWLRKPPSKLSLVITNNKLQQQNAIFLSSLSRARANTQ